MVTLNSNKAAQMTGRELMEAIGLMVDGRWQNNHIVPFATDNGRKWNAYTTSGRGRHSGTTYLHMYTDVQTRIVNPDGSDTGQRMAEVAHLRCKASEQIWQAKEI